MPTGSPRNRRLSALFWLGLLLFNYPLLSLFDASVVIFGLPLLYAYLFGVWLLLILCLALTSRRRPTLPLPDAPRQNDRFR